MSKIQLKSAKNVLPLAKAIFFGETLTYKTMLFQVYCQHFCNSKKSFLSDVCVFFTMPTL